MVMILVQEKTKRARVGPLPGVTQDIAGFKVRNIQQHRWSDYAVVACFLMAIVLLPSYCGNCRRKGVLLSCLFLLMLKRYCIQIAHRPSVYVLDSPGVLVPSIPDIETGLKLALAGVYLIEP